MTIVNTTEAAACTAVATAMVFSLRRVAEISEMITKQMGPTVIWYTKVQISISVAVAHIAPVVLEILRKPMMNRRVVMTIIPAL
jgi:hypothetical protein